MRKYQKNPDQEASYKAQHLSRMLQKCQGHEKEGRTQKQRSEEIKRTWQRNAAWPSGWDLETENNDTSGKTGKI